MQSNCILASTLYLRIARLLDNRDGPQLPALAAECGAVFHISSSSKSSVMKDYPICTMKKTEVKSISQ
jgi:hypothetical protein